MWLCSYVPSMTDGQVTGVSIVVRDITERKRTEEAVRASEARLQLAMRAGQLGTFQRDLVTGTLSFDARCQELYGVPAGEPVDQALGRVHPDDRDEVDAAIARALDPADPADDYDIDHRLVIDGEEPRWLSVRAHVRFDGEGDDRRPVEMIGVALDISEDKATAKALEVAAAQLKLALAVGAVGTYDVDLSTRVVAFDEGGQSLLGAEPQMPLDDAFAMIHADDRDDVVDRFETAADPASPDDLFRSVHRQRRPDGETLWVVSRGVFQFEGEPRRAVRLLGSLADITELKEAQDAVRHQLVEIDSYFDALPVAIAVFDRDGRYVRVNGAMEGLIGAPADRLVGTFPEDHVPAGHVDANEALLRRALDTGEPLRDVEMTLPSPADPRGGDRSWLSSFIPLVDGGVATGATVVVRDVTALKRAQVGLERLTAELEARVVERTAEVRQLVGDLTEAERRERGRVAQVLHDDLQQLLYAVQFKFEAMRRSAETAPLLDQADNLVARAIHVTRTLTVDLSPPVLRGEGLDRTFEWLGHRMNEAYGLAVTVEREGDVQAGKTVQVLLFQIVRELLFNVVKHAETMSAAIVVGPDSDGRVRVTVSDAGVGFDPDQVGEAAGTGVGLVSVRERIRLVGGACRSGPRRAAGRRSRSSARPTCRYVPTRRGLRRSPIRFGAHRGAVGNGARKLGAHIRRTLLCPTAPWRTASFS